MELDNVVVVVAVVVAVAVAVVVVVVVLLISVFFPGACCACWLHVVCCFLEAMLRDHEA